jgi:hypothetical protein
MDAGGDADKLGVNRTQKTVAGAEREETGTEESRTVADAVDAVLRVLAGAGRFDRRIPLARERGEERLKTRETHEQATNPEGAIREKLPGITQSRARQRASMEKAATAAA